MNLELMRKSNISGEYLLQLNDETITIGDQDILNTWTYYNRNLTYILPCKWNKRDSSGCSDANNTEYHLFYSGIFHGNRNTFHANNIITKDNNYVLNRHHAVLQMYHKDFLSICTINEALLHSYNN